MTRPNLSKVLAATVVVFGLTGPALACPNCKEAVAVQPNDSGNAAKGFNISVMFMVSVPFALLGTGTLMVFRAVKRGGFPEL